MCECDKDIMRIHLDSETDTRSNSETGRFEFDIHLPVKRNTYKKIILYVDDFDIQTKGLATDSYILHGNFAEYNTFNSRTKASNTVLASMFANATGTGRTTDFALNYQGTTKPIIIQNIPDTIVLQVKDIDNIGVDFSSPNNFWLVDLRIEAYY